MTDCGDDERILALVRQAGRAAFVRALQSGERVVYKVGDDLVERLPGGQQRVLRRLPAATTAVPGTVLKRQRHHR